MQAIVLAAGMGKRLGEHTKNNTKCMVKVNGVPLIDRLLQQLSRIKLERIIIVVGYKRKELVAHIESIEHDLKIEFIVNPIYDKTNNIYSLALAKEKMAEDDTLLIESDLIFDEKMFRLILNNPYPNIALVAKYESWMDGTMVRIDEDCNIVNFIPKADFNYSDTHSYYKTVNIYKFSKEFSKFKYIPFLEAYTKSIGTNEYYENVLRIISFLNSHDLKALPIKNEKWYEIDDKQDLDIAEAIFSSPEDLLKKYYGRYGGFWRFPQMLDFCYLVNPYFRKSKIIDELEANFRTLLGEYPSGMKVNSLLASKCWGIKEEYVIPGNGAAELIKILLNNIVGKTGIVRPTFEEYPNRLNEQDIISFIPQNRDFRYNVKELIHFFDKKDISNLIIVNPDNPSGNFMPIDDLHKLAEWCKDHSIRLIVDESFVDFCDKWETSSLLSNTILENYPTMGVMKSISKSYGVPGLRLGIFASADRKLIANMKKEVSIWNINSFAEFFMQIFSKYEKDYHKACSRFIEVRDKFVRDLEKIPYLHIMPTQANFILCEVLAPYTANSLALYLLSKANILISACSAKKGITANKYIRLAIRSEEDNSHLIEALKTLSNEKTN